MSRPPTVPHPVSPGWARRNLEETRWQSRQWKEGYAAACRHRKWTVAALLVAAVFLLRRTRLPLAAILIWIAMLGVCLLPVVVLLLIVEHVHRRRMRAALAMTARDDPFPPWDGPSDGEVNTAA